MNELPSPDQLRPWIEDSLSRQENIVATSNQGTILLYQANDQNLIIKTAMGSGLLLKLRQRTLIREHQAYVRLQGLTGLPLCHGMIDDRYLLLEYVDGQAYRGTDIPDREQWFETLHEILKSIHQRGVSHGDLKNKGNLMVRTSGQPCVIDFGTSFLFKPGFHPINNWLFRAGKRLDINAWVKHKYRGFYGDASEADSALLDYSWIEKLIRRLRGRPMDRLESDGKK
jgi:serine/threonine protein kinase